MKTEELTTEDLLVLISALQSQQITLTKSGDYPEKDRDRRLMKKLLNLNYELKATGGVLVVVHD